MKRGTQSDLQFLLKNGWRLVEASTVESPTGDVTTKNIAIAARIWRAKLRAIQRIDRKASSKFLRQHLTKETFWSKLFA